MHIPRNAVRHTSLSCLNTHSPSFMRCLLYLLLLPSDPPYHHQTTAAVGIWSELEHEERRAEQGWMESLTCWKMSRKAERAEAFRLQLSVNVQRRERLVYIYVKRALMDPEWPFQLALYISFESKPCVVTKYFILCTRCLRPVRFML